MKNTLLIVTLLATGAMFGLPQAAAQEKPVREQVAPTTSPVPAGAAQPEGQRSVPAVLKEADALPAVPLNQDILFKLLSADLAYQRGYWKVAFKTTMRVARQTRDPRIARRAAEIAASVRRPAESMEAVRLWRELAPHSDEAARYFLGFVLLGNDLSEAHPIFAQRLKEAQPLERGIMMFQIQRLLAGAGDKEQAFALLEQLLAPYQAMPEAHVALAQGAFGKGDRARAELESQWALKLKPDFELAALTLAQASGDPDQAERILVEYAAAYPKARDVRIALARILLAQKKYEPARREFEALLELQPQDLVSLYSLGILSAQARDPKNAERYLVAYLEALDAQKSDERDPAQVLLLLAQMADERGDGSAALKWLEQVEQRPAKGAAYVSARIKRAQIIAKKGDVGSARKLLLDTEAADDAGQAQLILAHGQILRDARQHQEAWKVLEAGLQQFPKNTSLLYDYAMAAEKLDKLVEMETALRLIMAVEPENYHAPNALGYSLADRNLRLPEALDLIGRALKLAPEDAFIIDSMGWVLFKLGKLDEAEALLRRAFAKRTDAEIAVHLAEVLWFKGQKDEARKLWREAAVREPDSETLKNTLKRLNPQP